MLYAGYANMYLKHYMPFQTVYEYTKCLYATQWNKSCCSIKFMSSKCVRRGDTRRSFAQRFTVQCDTICRAFGLCSSIPIVIWCDYCLLVALWFRFHIELAKCLLFRFRSSDLIPKYERQKAPRTRCERSLVYNRVVAWVVWKNLCFFVWYFFMTVMSSFWRYLFVGIALMVWPRTWPVGSYHCVARYWLHGNGQCLKRKRISVTTYIQVCLPSNVCLQ